MITSRHFQNLTSSKSSPPEPKKKKRINHSSYLVSGAGVQGRQPGFGLAGRVGPAHGPDRGLLPGPSVPVRVSAERTALHQAPRAPRRGLRALRASAESKRRGRQGECEPSLISTKTKKKSSLVIFSNYIIRGGV